MTREMGAYGNRMATAASTAGWPAAAACPRLAMRLTRSSRAFRSGGLEKSLRPKKSRRSPLSAISGAMKSWCLSETYGVGKLAEKLALLTASKEETHVVWLYGPKPIPLIESARRLFPSAAACRTLSCQLASVCRASGQTRGPNRAGRASVRKTTSLWRGTIITLAQRS